MRVERVHEWVVDQSVNVILEKDIQLPMVLPVPQIKEGFAKLLLKEELSVNIPVLLGM